MDSNRPVVVKRIPDRLNLKQARLFLREIEPILNIDRPQLVFDGSLVKQIDAAGVEMLLHCLARVIKRDGDLKLACLSSQMAVILEMTRTDRLFEIYETCSDAVLSFSRFLPAAMKRAPVVSMPLFAAAEAGAESAAAAEGAAAADLAA